MRDTHMHSSSSKLPSTDSLQTERQTFSATVLHSLNLSKDMPSILKLDKSALRKPF